MANFYDQTSAEKLGDFRGREGGKCSFSGFYSIKGEKNHLSSTPGMVAGREEGEEPASGTADVSVVVVVPLPHSGQCGQSGMYSQIAKPSYLCSSCDYVDLTADAAMQIRVQIKSAFVRRFSPNPFFPEVRTIRLLLLCF